MRCQPSLVSRAPPSLSCRSLTTGSAAVLVSSSSRLWLRSQAFLSCCCWPRVQAAQARVVQVRERLVVRVHSVSCRDGMPLPVLLPRQLAKRSPTDDDPRELGPVRSLPPSHCVDPFVERCVSAVGASAGGSSPGRNRVFLCPSQPQAHNQYKVNGPESHSSAT